MRIDASQVLGQGGFKIKAGTGAATDSLKEGDVVRAKVLSSDKNGNVSLKMEGGLSLTAKMGTDIKLSPGDMILLEVAGKDKGLISLSFSGVEPKEEEFPVGQTNLVRDFTDKSLAPYASKLAELNMPVTEEYAKMMRELIAQNPGLSLDEAAFLASNKITGDESLIKAALATLADGDKTAAMIAKLIALVSEQSSAPSTLPGDIQSGQTAPAFTVSTANAAPLTELLTMIVENSSSLLAASGQGESAPAPVTQTIITQGDTVMQTNAENVDDLLTHGKITQEDKALGQLSQGDGTAKPQPETGAPQSGTTTAPTTGATAEIPTPAGTTSQTGTPATPGTVVSGEPAAQGAQSALTPDAAAAQSQTNAAEGAQAVPVAPSMGNVVAQLLANIPEFSGTPQSALERFSDMLLRVAGDSQETDDNTELLTAQLDKLFTRVGKDVTDAGARLRDAREEMYARLSLIEEAMSRASGPARAEMLGQTQKLMEHVRLLNSIEQFVYMQMPVQMSDERKAADLYIFKRKGGKRADPDNINILLAIDLEHMGHWEALVNIKNKEVSIQMEVPEEAVKDHFNENTVLLHELLDEAGFKLVSTNIKLSEKETTPLTALSALDRYTGGKQGIIDFMI